METAPTRYILICAGVYWLTSGVSSIERHLPFDIDSASDIDSANCGVSKSAKNYLLLTKKNICAIIV